MWSSVCLEVCIQVASKFVEYTGSRDATSVIGVEGRRVWYKMGISMIIQNYFVVRGER